ncbi:hypothetical protein [Geminicoccus flavidas]|uniref:hypothetical protein n=1 Tax=Geminicoccus flavidas TaxID=2506407 RepID=UPI00135907D3|nr:hypothetical protein [Geminicoccus flavidas]
MTPTPDLPDPLLRRTGVRLRTSDLLTALVVAAALVLVAAVTWGARLDAAGPAPPDPAVAVAIADLRRSFGYDGIAHDLERLRGGGDPAVRAAAEAGLRQARAAIGLLRGRLGDADSRIHGALDQLEAAGRRAEILLRADPGEPAGRLLDLPVIEPLLVLDDAFETLRERAVARGTGLPDRLMLLLTGSACLLAASALLLAGWLRLGLLLPLRRLAGGLAAGDAPELARLALRGDEIGLLARRCVQEPPPAEPAGRVPVEQQRLLEEIRDLVRSQAECAAPPVSAPPPLRLDLSLPPAPEPSPERPLLAGAAVPEQPQGGTTALHSIVEMVAKEQLRRHGERPVLTGSGLPDDQVMAVLVDRVLARLDQVTQRVRGTDGGARPAS